MTIRAVLPPEGRDLRLDLALGIANWAIFIDHIPNNILMWITIRNYGFSDAAELFVFIAGYAAAIVYAKSMATQGFAAGTSRLFERAWQLYVAHVVLLVANVAMIGWAAATYASFHSYRRHRRSVHAHRLARSEIRIGSAADRLWSLLARSILCWPAALVRCSLPACPGLGLASRPDRGEYDRNCADDGRCLLSFLVEEAREAAGIADVRRTWNKP